MVQKTGISFCILLCQDNFENRTKSFYIQVNIGSEKQKSGVEVENLPNLYNYCLKMNIQIDGLMCIPPYEDEPSPYFLLLEKIASKHGFSKLSMGMSADFETAIQFGATHIRVGSEIFGQRQ